MFGILPSMFEAVIMCHHFGPFMPGTLDALDAGGKASKDSDASTAEKGLPGQRDVTPSQAVWHRDSATPKSKC